MGPLHACFSDVGEEAVKPLAATAIAEQGASRTGAGVSRQGRLLRRAGEVPVLGTLARALVRKLGSHSVTSIRTGPLRGLKWKRSPELANGYWLGTYEIEVQECLDRLLTPGQVVYDIGAHAGFFSLLAAIRVGEEGWIHAFEPLEENRQRLETQLRLNGCTNWSLESSAVAGRDGVGAFRRMESTSQGRLAGDVARGDGSEPIPVVTLDSYVRNHPVPSLIKMDVEGFEDDVLAGGLELLGSEAAPTLIIELHGPEVARRVVDRLQTFGYGLFDLQFRSIDPSHPPAHLVAFPPGRPVLDGCTASATVEGEKRRDSKRCRRLAIFVSHPVQYHVPIWRELASRPGVEAHVYYMSSTGIDGSVDPDFGLSLKWDLPLLDGYSHTFLGRGGGRRLEDALEGERGRADAVVIAGYTRPFERQVVRWAGRQGVPVIMRGEFSDLNPERSAGRRWARNLYLRWFYSRVEAFGVIGREAEAHLRRHGVEDRRLHFSPYGADSALFDGKGNGEAEALRESLGLKEGLLTLLFVGKLIERKRPMLLLEALERCRRRDEIQLLVVGEGPLRERLLKRGREVLGDRLKFAGFVDPTRIVPYFGVADLFVLPSRYEAWGVVVNEAMHCGLPALVSDRVSCYRDLVHPGETGGVFPSDDANALAAAIDRLASDRNTLKRMGEQARRRVAGYGPRQAADGLIGALDSVTASGRRAAPGEDGP